MDYSVGAAGAGAPIVPAPAADAPPWLQTLQVDIDQQFTDINQRFADINQQLDNIRQEIATMRNEIPILLANAEAGNHGPLLNPTGPGWVLLGPPNPTTRNELAVFTRESELIRNLFSIFHGCNRGAMHRIRGCAGPLGFTAQHIGRSATKADWRKIGCDRLIFFTSNFTFKATKLL